MKELKKQELKKLARFSKDILKRIFDKLKIFAKIIYKDYKAEQQLRQRQVEENNRLALGLQTRWELFCVFYNRKYPTLRVVEVIEDIIPFHLHKYGILFENPEKKTLPCLLQQVCGKMNFDIDCYRQWILTNYLPQEARMLYPCIMSGMYIADIKADGIYAVLTVKFPQ